MRLAIVTLALLAAAAANPMQGCSGGSNGSPGSTGSAIQDPMDAACEGHVCGESCGYCPPGVPASSCPVPTFAPTTCSARGECATAGAFVCAPAETCVGKACGVRCDPPCPKGASCSGPLACDGEGACVPFTEKLCPPPPPTPPCDGKVCGAECVIDPPCLQAGCLMPSLLGHCDATGACIPGGAVSCPPDPECAGKACGDDCEPCGGMCMHPYATACDLSGRCVPRTTSICYDPCSGKACGEQCQMCPPGVICAAVVTFCDGAGQCVPSMPSCP
jgi:hypothetical protein